MSAYDILTAIQAVAEGREKRHASPGVWRVYADSGLVYLEVYPAAPVVVTTTVSRNDEDRPD